jgi:hypothetical protein
MPVSGPNQELAYRQGDEATDRILELLEGTFGASRPHPEMPLGKKLSQEWDELEIKLREIVKEMIWVDHCASW